MLLDTARASINIHKHGVWLMTDEHRYIQTQKITPASMDAVGCCVKFIPLDGFQGHGVIHHHHYPGQRWWKIIIILMITFDVDFGWNYLTM